jgi:hypothetical protein
MYHTEISSLLDMVDRGCRRMMKGGGGPLPKDGFERTSPQVRRTPEEKRAALEIAATGLYTCAQIQKATGIRHQSIKTWCDRAGIKLPCGWQGKRRRV